MKRKRRTTSRFDALRKQWAEEEAGLCRLPSLLVRQIADENNTQNDSEHERTTCTHHSPVQPVSSQYPMSPRYSHTPYIMDWKIPKTCVCGYSCFDGLSQRHLSSNAHNFYLRDRRLEMGDPIRGNCDICGLKNLRHLERHRLTNSHIKRADATHTADEIRRHIQQRASTSCSSSREC
jgi:hypothetical protein